MTPQQIFATGLRVLALWLGLTAISYMGPVPLVTGMHFKANTDTLSMYVAGGSMVAVALLLWFFPQAVAHRLIPPTRFDDHLKLNLHEVARACAALTGLWIFSRALPALLWYVMFFWLSDSKTSAFGMLGVGGKASFVITCFEFLLALALMLRSADFARLLVREVRA